MRCEEFEQRLNQLFDRRQPLRPSGALLEHADACARCGQTLSGYQRLQKGVSSLEPPQLDAEFTQRVVQRMKVSPRTSLGHWHGLVAMAIAASLLVAVGAGLWHRQEALDSNPLASTSAPFSGESPDASVAVDPATDEASPADISDGPPDLLLSPDQWQSLLAHWSGAWRGRWEPVDPLAGGFRPITTSLTVALDELRNAISLVPAPQETGAADSAGNRLPIVGGMNA